MFMLNSEYLIKYKVKLNCRKTVAIITIRISIKSLFKLIFNNIIFYNFLLTMLGPFLIIDKILAKNDLTPNTQLTLFYLNLKALLIHKYTFGVVIP